MDKKFAKGIYYKEPSAKAPDFVIARTAINRTELEQMLIEEEGEWINLDVLRSKKGEPYLVINDWKPKKEKLEYTPNNDDLPL